jgi:putative addiction module component (TIGR02574 family)
MTLSQHDIEMLTVVERLELIERVWDSLTMTQDDIPLTNSQRAELDRRIDELEEKGPVGIPWEQVLDRIKSKGA